MRTPSSRRRGAGGRIASPRGYILYKRETSTPTRGALPARRGRGAWATVSGTAHAPADGKPRPGHPYGT